MVRFLSIFPYILSLIYFVALLLPGKVWAADGTTISDVYHFRSYDGLGSERVFSILEGTDRAVWFGTRVGVDRFNGKRFKHYQLADNESDGNFAGRVVKIFTYADKQVGAYDNAGRIYRYSPSLDQFELSMRLSEWIKGEIVLNEVRDDGTGNLLLCLTSGLYRVRNGKVEPLLTKRNVNDVVATPQGLYVATTAGGILLRQGKVVSRFLNGVNIQTLYHDKRHGDLYLGTFDSGLWSYRPSTGAEQRLGVGIKAFESPIRAIEPIADTQLAVGIDGGGIYRLETKTGETNLLLDTDDGNRFYLNGNGVYALMHDSNHNLWCGSYTGGVSAILFRPSAVSSILHEQGNPQTVRNNNINGIAESRDGSIWFATDRGISIFSPRGGVWHHSAMRNVVVCLEPMSDGGMVAGTYGNGLYIMDAAGNVKRNLTKADAELSSNAIFSIKRMRNGEYWVATLDGGVIRFDSSFQLVHTYPVNVAFSLAETPDGKVAVATANGFFLINPNTNGIEHYADAQETERSHSGMSPYIVCMLFNPDGTVWLGTEGEGLTLYDIRTRRPKRVYKIADGLPSNDIFSIRRDRHGRIMVGTGNGLAIFNGKRFKSLNYYRGLAKEYNKSASVMLSNGDLLFGSVFGAERINPSQLIDARYDAQIKVTEMDVEEESKFRRTPIKDGVAKIRYSENSFQLHFEAINLPYQDDIAYQYMLEGYDKNWSNVTRTGEAMYKNVSPGNYRFKVRSVRLSNGSVIDETSIRISVGAPWWDSWWAWCFYIAIVIFLGWLFYKYKLYKWQKHYDQDKIRFFINTAHDIRTPVSLVMAPVNDLKAEESLSQRARELVEMASTNIAKLHSITTQLLEFERFDTGHNKLRNELIDVRELLNIEIGCFRDSFQRKGVALRIDMPEESVKIEGDRYLLEMMFDNLLSNALKYTPAGGEVTLGVECDRRRVSIAVSDNGIGIPDSDRRKVMREVHRARNARESNTAGTGFGLLQVRRIVELLGGKVKLQSKEGVGTTVTATFGRVFAENAQTIDEKLTTVFVETATPTEYQAPVETSGNHTLLIVEDNDDLRHYLTNMFGKNYKVSAAASGEEALEYLKENYPDLILSDVMMPGIQGDELCRKIKENPETEGIPVILLTAKADHISVLEGLGCGADDYIAKPFNSDLLRMKVSGLIANRDRMRHFLLRGAVESVIETPIAIQTPIVESTAEVDPQEESESNLSEVPNDLPSKEEPNVEEVEHASADREFVERATALVIARMADSEFGIDELCREMAMSRTLFFNRLKSLTGKAPQDFIRLLKLERAAELLRQGELVIDVAEHTGFVNVKYFSTVFKKHFGLPPSQFVKQ